MIPLQGARRKMNDWMASQDFLSQNFLNKKHQPRVYTLSLKLIEPQGYRIKVSPGLQKQEVKRNKFFYRKVGSAITKWGAIEKSPILLFQLSELENQYYNMAANFNLYFGGTNNIFVDCSAINSLNYLLTIT